MSCCTTVDVSAIKPGEAIRSLGGALIMVVYYGDSAEIVGRVTSHRYGFRSDGDRFLVYHGDYNAMTDVFVLEWQSRADLADRPNLPPSGESVGVVVDEPIEPIYHYGELPETFDFTPIPYVSQAVSDALNDAGYLSMGSVIDHGGVKLIGQFGRFTQGELTTINAYLKKWEMDRKYGGDDGTE